MPQGQRSTALFILLSIGEWPERYYGPGFLLIAIRGDDWPCPLPRAGEAALKRDKHKNKSFKFFLNHVWPNQPPPYTRVSPTLVSQCKSITGALSRKTLSSCCSSSCHLV